MANENLTFTYKAKDKKGKSQTGEIDAPNINFAKVLIRKQGLVVESVKQKRKPWLNRSKITTGDVAFFTRQLATMLRAGVPLTQSLDIAASGLKNVAFKNLIAKIKVSVDSGVPLADSFKRHPAQFGDLYVNLVEAGELSGALEGMLDRLALYMEKSEALKRKIKKAMSYPITVMVIACVITTGLLIKVIPTFESLFDSVGGELPTLTRKVLDLSEWLQTYGLYLLVFIVISVVAFKVTKARSKKFRDGLDRFVLKMPLFGKLAVKSSQARIARTLATTYSAGVPLIEGLDACAGAAGNVVYHDAVRSMQRDVSSGQQLAFSMRQTDVFDPLMVQMTSIGEESGAIDEMQDKIAEHYEDEVDSLVDGLTAMMEPFIMVFLGALIGTIVLAIYLPIFKMGDAFQ